MTAENSSLESSAESFLPESQPKFQNEVNNNEHSAVAEVTMINVDVSNQPIKTDTLNDEGFCCVMSMFDGVVL